MNEVEANQDEMLSELFSLLETFPNKWENLEDAKNEINNIIEQEFNNFLICQPVDKQKNKEFRKLLHTSLENIIFAYFHEHVFNLVCDKFKNEDEDIYKKCLELSALKVTADQLGALEDYAIPLPAAIVELASLDMHATPRDKFNSLSACFDLIFAELKGAIVDILSNTKDNGIPVLNNSDITPILATVIIHSKPLHLISNMYYIENLSSEISECECILAFKTAIDKLNVITLDTLQPRSSRIYCDIALKDILEIASNIDNKFDRKGRKIIHPKNPLERHIERFTENIAAATLSNVQQ